jgi:Bacterial cell division membrane protein
MAAGVRNVKNENEKTSRIDYGIILCVMLLAIIGLFSLYSTTVLVQSSSIRMTIMQIIWYIIGTGVAATVMLFDSEQLWKITHYLYWIGIVALIFTLIFYDRELAISSGARRWVNIPIINLFYNF